MVMMLLNELHELHNLMYMDGIHKYRNFSIPIMGSVTGS
jgi:hypothetical protein